MINIITITKERELFRAGYHSMSLVLETTGLSLSKVVENFYSIIKGTSLTAENIVFNIPLAVAKADEKKK